MHQFDRSIHVVGCCQRTTTRLIYNGSYWNTCKLMLTMTHTWNTSTLEKKVDALDNWCLRRILHIHCTDFVSNDVARSRMGQPLLSGTIRQRHLFFFGHLCRADIGQDHSWALRACIRDPPKDLRRITGRPRQTWPRTVEDDLCLLNFGLVTARRCAIDRPAWRLLVDAATSSWHAPQRERHEYTDSYSCKATFTLTRVPVTRYLYEWNSYEWSVHGHSLKQAQTFVLQSPVKICRYCR